MMDCDDCKKKVVSLIDGYLQGTVTREAVWQWAKEVMVSDELPMDLNNAIHGIWLLHDDDEDDWVPDNDELKQIRDGLV